MWGEGGLSGRGGWSGRWEERAGNAPRAARRRRAHPPARRLASRGACAGARRSRRGAGACFFGSRRCHPPPFPPPSTAPPCPQSGASGAVRPGDRAPRRQQHRDRLHLRGRIPCSGALARVVAGGGRPVVGCRRVGRRGGVLHQAARRACFGAQRGCGRYAWLGEARQVWATDASATLRCGGAASWREGCVGGGASISRQGAGRGAASVAGGALPRGRRRMRR